MLVLEYKLVASKQQQQCIGEAIKTCQFIRNKAVRLWMDTGVKAYDLNRYCSVLARDYPFANALNSQATASGIGESRLCDCQVLETR